MSALVTNPVPIFLDSTGAPLQGGSIYVGLPNTDPTKNPIDIFQDAGLSIPFPQPINTTNGLPTLQGSPRQIFLGADATTYSIAVFDSAGNMVQSLPSVEPTASVVAAGNMNLDTFVAATDFVAGTTTQLTLSGNPGSAQNVFLTFDPVLQFPPSDYGVSGKTLTFTSAIPEGTTTVRARYGTTLAVGAPGAGTVTDAAIAAGTKLYQRITDWVDVKDPAYGAKGDGTTDDTAAIVNCLNANPGKTVYFPKGTYVFKTPTTLAAGNNVSIVGDPGDSIIDAVGVTLNGTGLLSWSGASGFSITGMTFNFNSGVCAVGSEQVVGMISCSDWSFTNNQILNLTGIGIVGNNVQRFLIDNNYITRAAPATVYNQAINIESSAGQSADGTISNNTCVGSGTDFSGIRLKIVKNSISGWSFGSGITIEQSATSQNYTIDGNYCFGSVGGPDVNSTYPCGIESWGAYSTITNNQCYSNSGDGIVFGGQHCVVKGNICFNNGQVGGGNGITARYGNANYNASYSVVDGNACFDTQTPHTQGYGYAEQAGGLQYMTISQSNNFDGSNLSGPVSINSANMNCVAPVLEFAATVTPGAIASGAQFVTLVNCPGAAFADYALVGFSQDILGCTISGNIQSANEVRVVFANLTGSSQTIPQGQVRVKLFKPNAYAQF